jgi:Subtilase family
LADDWFNELHTYVNPVIDGNRKGHSNPAKVAILDTGIDVRHPSISKALNNSIKAWRGFPESSDPFKDVEGHGTFLACVLMRTAPRTLLYIARIFNDSLKFTDVEVAKVRLLSHTLTCRQLTGLLHNRSTSFLSLGG